MVSVVAPASSSPPPPLVPLHPARTSDPSATTAAPAANAFRIFMLCLLFIEFVRRSNLFVASHTNVLRDYCDTAPTRMSNDIDNVFYSIG